MENKYSKTKFDDYTHRFIVEFETGDPYIHSVHFYSNNGSHQELEKFIDSKKTEKVMWFKIIYRSTKENDEMTTKLIDDFLLEI